MQNVQASSIPFVPDATGSVGKSSIGNASSPELRGTDRSSHPDSRATLPGRERTGGPSEPRCRGTRMRRD